VAALLLFAAAMACSPACGQGASVVINGPPSGTAVVVGQEVLIDSTATADAGVARVELAIDGVVVRRDSPPSGNPTTFRVSQGWTPDAQGQVAVSVVAYDLNGNASPQVSLTLQVVASSGVVPTTAPGATAVPGPAATEVPDVTVEAGCTLNASYVADVTIPDDTEVAPSSTIVKTWRIRNSGTCDWTADFKLLFVSGDQMSGEAVVAVTPTAAGSTTDLSVNLTAPVSPGTYRGNWRMQSDEGLAFGSTFYVQIVVPAPATDTPPPTDVPTETSVPPTESAPVEVDIVASADSYWWPGNVACMIGGCPDFGGSTELELSNNATGGGGGTLPILWPGLVVVQFDLSGIPADATIESATMHLYLASASGATSVNIRARRATSPWSEGDHSVKPVCGTDGDSSRNVGSGSGWYDWDVESDVDYQHANPTTNYGFCMTVGGDGDKRVFRSREGASASRPYLRVVYLP
jgi:hypothetical protein